MYSVLWGGIFCIYLLISLGVMSYLRKMISLLIFIWMICWFKWYVKVTLYYYIAISPFSCVNIWFICLGSWCYILFLDWPLYHYVMTFSVSYKVFILKNILFDISIAMKAFFWFLFSLNTFFMSSLKSECFLISEVSLL